jgi:hypothetical protein
MKQTLSTLLLGASLVCSPMAFAGHDHDHDKSNHTVGEKTADKARDAKRATKKGVNRVKEAVCMEGDVECAAKKAKHRVEEATDATVDKAKEVKDKVD